MSIRFIPGYDGAMINIETDEDIAEALAMIVHQIKEVDLHHPILDDLDPVVSMYLDYLGD